MMLWHCDIVTAELSLIATCLVINSGKEKLFTSQKALYTYIDVFFFVYFFSVLVWNLWI
jgi:hypothetical protein